MVFAFIKFIHLICVLVLTGLVAITLGELFITKFKSLFLPSSKELEINLTNITIIYPSILILTLGIATLSGISLVHHRGYTFITPWIQAALALVSLLFILLGSKLYFYRYSKIYLSGEIIFYSLFLILLIIIINDAVQKDTLLPWFPLKILIN